MTKRCVNGTTPVVLSLTTHGHRLESVWVTLESIANGELQPSRTLMFLDERISRDQLPKSLKEFEARGLELLFVKDLGPHTKYYYAVPIALAMDKPLVTIDDDVIYPPSWLAHLHQAYIENRSVINCYRARDMKFDYSGNLLPYVTWPLTSSTEPRYSVFLTGVSGVIYPVAFLRLLGKAGEGFRDRCPKSDDIWLNFVAARAGFRVRQITADAQHFPIIPGTQDFALWRTNLMGAKYRQLLATYDKPTLARVRADSQSARVSSACPGFL
jgi:hypothetical protein